MTPTIPQFIFTGLGTSVIGALIGGLIVHYLTGRRERESRIRAFRAYVKSVKLELETISLKREAADAGNPYFLYDWQTKAIPGIRAKCCEIGQDLRTVQETDLTDLMLLFSHQMARDVDPYQGKEPDKPLLFEDTRQRLAGILEKMLACAT